MYHRTRFQTPVLIALAISTINAPLGNCAAEAVKHISPAALTASKDGSWRTPPIAKQLKRRPTGIEVYQWDESPIGNRAPLVMVHGLLGEYWDCFRWRKLLSHLTADPQFSQRYKVLLVRYDTHAPLQEVVPAFRDASAKISEAFGGQPLHVVALSMGGNLVQDSMRNPDVDKRIASVLTMGTPFHGSPLFSYNWMEYSILKHYRSPISRLDTALPYKLYFNRHKNLLADLHWDNADGMIPSVGKFRYIFPLLTKGQLSPKASENLPVLELNKPGAVDKSKFTVYGGFLLSDYALVNPPPEIISIAKVPYRFTFTLLPEHLGREHPVLRALNQHIARAVTSGNTRNKTGLHLPKYVYGLNDGIAPVVSALYLPTQALDGLALTQTNIPELKKIVDVKRARIFKNIDHLTFIDDYHPLGAPEQLKDELDPQLEKRSIFDWVKGDLLN